MRVVILGRAVDLIRLGIVVPLRAPVLPRLDQQVVPAKRVSFSSLRGGVMCVGDLYSPVRGTRLNARFINITTPSPGDDVDACRAGDGDRLGRGIGVDGRCWVSRESVR